MEIKTVAIVGMGALGLLFGNYIQERIGSEHIYFLMDEERKTRYRNRVYTCNGQEVCFAMKSADDITEPMDLVLFSVKYNGMNSAVKMLKQSGCVGDNTTMISLMNGIDSEQVLEKTFGEKHVVYCVAQGMDAMRFGSDLKYTKMGELHIGIPEGREDENLNALTAFFDSIEFPYVKEQDIVYRLWAKFMLNVGINQTCMVYNAPYGTVLAEGEAHDVFVGAMKETVTVANAEHVPLSDQDVAYYIQVISTLDPNGYPSMAQDRINHVPSEVEMFSGRIIELGEKHAIDVPVNRMLYEKVREIEKEYK